MNLQEGALHLHEATGLLPGIRTLRENQDIRSHPLSDWQLKDR